MLLHLGQNVITSRTLLHLGLFITFRPSRYGSVRIVHVVFFFCVLGIDVELARSIEERIMLEDAQSWMNGRTIHEIKDKSGMAYVDEFTCLKVQKKGHKKKHGNCLATFLQNELNSDVARVTVHVQTC